LALAPDDPSVDQLHAAERHATEGRLDLALLALRRHLHGHPATPAVLLRIGRLGREVGAYDLAREALEAAIDRDPLGVDLYRELARLHLATDDLAEARAASESAVDHAPEDAAAWNLLGRVEMAESRWPAAEVAFRRAVELDPTHGWYLNNLGLLYVMQGDGESAESALLASLEMFEERPPRFVYNNLGLALELQAKLEPARRAFEDALSVDPRYTRAHVNLQRVEAAIRATAVARSDGPVEPVQSIIID
jgi:tetratricopeptide (TPR) repeat protein